MEFEIRDVEITGVESAVKAAGYPMMKDGTYKTAVTLGTAKSGSGHDCYLKGIVVLADVVAPQYWWLQFGRYHFADIVSSESKMHMLLKMNISDQCNEYVSLGLIDYLTELINLYTKTKDKEIYKEIIANCPMGLLLKARITTNYLQLKTIHSQRKNHKLDEWRTFCNWIEELPLMKEMLV